MIIGLATSPVQNIMLGHENDIKEHADITKTELGPITGDAAPVRIQRTVYEQLGDAEYATCEIKQNLPDRPAFGRFGQVIGIYLWYVLDAGDEQFDVGRRIHLPGSLALLVLETRMEVRLTMSIVAHERGSSSSWSATTVPTVTRTSAAMPPQNIPCTTRLARFPEITSKPHSRLQNWLYTKTQMRSA